MNTEINVIDHSKVIKQISAVFKTPTELSAAYMPFIQNGGVFIKTKENFKLGELILVALTLPNENLHSFQGKVIWITPKGAQASMSMGIGVQIPFESNDLKNEIETCLIGINKNYYNTEIM